MKVLQVAEACSAGVGRHVASLSRGLESEGHQVTVAYSPHRLDGAFERFMAQYENHIQFRPIDVQREISPASDIRSVARLVHLVRSEGPFDIIHGHSAKGGALARLAGRLTGRPTVYTPHGLIMSSPDISRRKAALYGVTERVLGQLATSRMIAVSEEEREFILRLGLIADKRAKFIPNSIEDRDFECFGAESLCKASDYRPLTFGSTMRFSPQKAPERLVRAFMEVTQSLPHLPLRLVIAGEGELYEEIKAEVASSGWDGSILLPGWSDDAAGLLKMTDVFVVSSLYEAGLSFSTMEAMAAGLPVVSTEVFGTRRTLTQVPGNVLLPVGDTVALAGGMRRMATLSEPDSLRAELRAIGAANREYVRENFIQSEVTRRTAGLYHELCGPAYRSPSSPSRGSVDSRSAAG